MSLHFFCAMPTVHMQCAACSSLRLVLGWYAYVHKYSCKLCAVLPSHASSLSFHSRIIHCSVHAVRASGFGWRLGIGSTHSSQGRSLGWCRLLPRPFGWLHCFAGKESRHPDLPAHPGAKLQMQSHAEHQA